MAHKASLSQPDKLYFLLTLLIVLASFSSYPTAAVFKCIDDDGKTTFSDKPCPQDTEESIHLLPMNSRHNQSDYSLGSTRNWNFVRAMTTGDLATVRRLLVSDPQLANDELPIHNLFQVHALHIASGIADVEIVKLLLYFKADPNSKDEHGRTPLFFALGGLKPSPLETAKHKKQSFEERTTRETIAKLLVDAGADLGAKTDTESILTIAAYHDNVWIAQQCLALRPSDAQLQIALRWTNTNGSSRVAMLFAQKGIKLSD